MIAALRLSARTKGATMLFAVFDHNDATGLPAARQLDQRLELVAAYERLGYYAYQLAEHHGTPLGIATLDQLTNGRLVLGVGRGVSPVETGFHGVPGAEAQPRFDEAFEILRLGLS